MVIALALKSWLLNYLPVYCNILRCKTENSIHVCHNYCKQQLGISSANIIRDLRITLLEEIVIRFICSDSK